MQEQSFFALPVVFYDQRCALCSDLVLVLLFLDRKKILFFAPLAGKTAKKYLPSSWKKEDRFLLFFYHQKVFVKSTAFLKILMCFGWRWVGMFLWVPESLRDLFYHMVSWSRFKWRFFFFRKKSAYIFEKNRSFFLD